MKTFLKLYVTGYIISYFLIAGWMNADLKGKYGCLGEHQRRQDLGFAVSWSAAAAAFWPLFVPGAFCWTGFADHGWSLSMHLEKPCP